MGRDVWVAAVYGGCGAPRASPLRADFHGGSGRDHMVRLVKSDIYSPAVLHGAFFWPDVGAGAGDGDGDRGVVAGGEQQGREVREGLGGGAPGGATSAQGR